jgi:YbbR domain-containing protein
VDVRVRGPSGTLSRLAAGDMVAVLDLQAARPGQRLFHLTPDQIRTPFGVEVAQVNPPTVALRFETAATRAVPVAPAVIGEVAEGFVIRDITAEPPTVEVIGPQSAILRLSEALTEPVSVEGAKTSVREAVTVGAAGPNVRLKTAQRAIVTVDVVPAPTEQTLDRVPVRVRNVASGLMSRAIPSVVTVRVRGSREAVDRLRSDAVTVFVDVAGLGPGLYELPLRTDRTATFGVAGMEPSVVQIVLE